jgi:glycosyltransferase involved in cell wall biosynthesis
MDKHQKLNILFINTDLPIFPGRGGVEFLHSTHLASIANRVGIISQLHTREQKEKSQGLLDAGVELFLWEYPFLLEKTAPILASKHSLFRTLAKFGADVLRTGFWRPRDTLLHDKQFRNIAPAVQASLSQPWQVLSVIQSNCAKYLDYVPHFPVSILVFHDIRALVFERQAQTEKNIFRRISCLLEAHRYRRFEGKYARKYDLVVTVSTADEKWVTQHYHPNRILTLPLPIDPNYFMPLDDVTEIPGRIVFTGMMNHPPNVDAAIFFATQVFPIIRRQNPTAEFWIVGRDPLPEVQALANLQGITVTGLVPDIRSYMAEAAVIVVPLRYGSGMRQKILEAWAMKKAVISTSIGAEGIDYHDGQNILIADTASTLAEATLNLLSNLPARNNIREQGRSVVCTQHHPDVLAQKYYQKMEEILAAKASSVQKKILIDLRWMLPGVAGGIENLSRSLLKELADVKTSTQFTVFAPSQVKYDLGIHNLHNFKVVPIDGPGVYWRKFTWRLQRFFAYRLHFDYWRTPEVEDLLRISSYQAEVALSIPGYIYPDLKSLLNVLIVPDIQHEYFPDFFTPTELDERRRLYRDSIDHSVMLLAISDFTRQTLIEKLGIPPEKIITTHLAADSIFLSDSPDRSSTADVLKKYDLEGKQYFFFPGNTWNHKNHKTAFKALYLLLESTQKDIHLVCTGTIKSAQQDLIGLLADLHLENRVHFLGYCPRSDLPGLYQGAVGLVFPSYFEGFGMPVLEAMLSGCPVICSGTSSLPEIAGDAAILCNPDSPVEFANGMQRLLEDTQLKDELIAKGRLQAAKFSWKKFSYQVLSVLEDVIDRKYRPDMDINLHEDSFEKKSEPPRFSLKDLAQSLINKSTEQRRQGQPLKSFYTKTLSWFVSPEVAFYGSLFSSINTLKRSGKIQRKINSLLSHTRKVDDPQTQQLLAHTEPWSDTWAGPHLAIIQTEQKKTQSICVEGWADIRSLGGSLLLEFHIDGQFAGQKNISRSGDFHFNLKLDQPLSSGSHVIEIDANRYFVPHQKSGIDDFRPLSYKLFNLKMGSDR